MSKVSLGHTRFAIRDDDVCYWAKPEELENIYKEFWTKEIPVFLQLFRLLLNHTILAIGISIIKM